MKCILVGYGEIGKGVKAVYGAAHQIAAYDPLTAPLVDSGEYDLLLVAIPYGPRFIEAVRDYQQMFSVKATIVFSTTAIGTCSQLGAVHCPIEGKHPDLAESIGCTSRWLGGIDPLAERFFTEAGAAYRVLPKPGHTEWLKLRSTTLYGLNIEYARYCKQVCDDLGMEYSACKEWDDWYNALYADHFGQPQYTRMLLDPPTAAKGGHCVTPNAVILHKQYPSPLTASVGEVEYGKELGR